MKLLLITISVLLQSCMLGLGVGYSPEYRDIIGESSGNPIGIIKVSHVVYESDNKSGRLVVYGEHISSIASQKDNKHGGVGGINMIGTMLEFGN